jgi:feruloyl esterase
MSSNRLLTITVVLSCVMLFISAPAFSIPPIVDYSSVANKDNCTALKSYVAGLTDETFDKPVTNVTADWKTSSSGATFCQVTGWIWPEIKFQVTMPTLWNERYQMNGGGGWDGRLSVPIQPNADGYAQSSANGGYMSGNWPSSCGSFGLKEPEFSEYHNPDPLNPKYPNGSGGYYSYPDASSYVGQGNPDACQKVVDFGYRHLYETPLIAKKIVERYYQKAPTRSYYSGGSCGGKEGQISAQLFPELYDGFFIGYPLGGHLAVTFRGTWDTFWGAGLVKQADPSCVPSPPSVTCPSVYNKYKAALHYKTVYGKCDAVDGLVDGIIDDPTKCKFDAMTDLPACTPGEEAVEGVGGVYSSTCFTLAQRQALKEIYAGPHNSEGMAWYPGQPLGAEYVTKTGSIGFGAALADGMAPCMFANIALDPPEGPNFDITKFDWDLDPILMQQTTCQACDGGTCQEYNIHDTLDGITISPEPEFNMGGFEAVYAKGAKIVQTHGWSDALVTALAASRELYETSLQTMGVEKTKSFWKLYLVPGAGHGGGGLSCWVQNTTAFNAMVDWVENGIEPGAIIGSRNANVDANYPEPRTRPNCPYPEVARYIGTGSIDDAANFMCVPPIDVRIEPETLNLKSKGVFNAFITVPEGYNLRQWNIGNLSCEGAVAVRGVFSGNTYLAKFNRQDLVNVPPGNAVTLTVKGTFTHDGKTAQIQASDTIRVIR